MLYLGYVTAENLGCLYLGVKHTLCCEEMHNGFLDVFLTCCFSKGEDGEENREATWGKGVMLAGSKGAADKF